MKRAVGDEQKNQRREEILAHAALLLAGKDFESMTLSEVAAGLGLVKGTLYRYFSTKESLVLEILEWELELWLADLTEAFKRSVKLRASELARTLAQSLANRPLLVRLFSIVHVVLERNLPLDRMIEFKKKTATALGAGAQLLEGVCPQLLGKGAEAVLALYELAIGVGHLTDRSTAVEEALKTPGLEVFRLDFQNQLEKTFSWTLVGMTT